MTTSVDLVRLSSSLEAAAEARAAVRKCLEGAADDTVDRACLLVDELVASALKSVGGPVTLVLERHPDHLIVDVINPSSPPPDDVPISDRIGAGRIILDAWADQWGSLHHTSGGSVWFSIATT